MTRLTDIKDQLLEARKETQAELNQIDRALDAIGIQREQQPRAEATKPKRKRVRPASQQNTQRIMGIIEASNEPLTARQVSERANMPRERAGKIISWLEQEGEVKKEGFVKAPGGKGRAVLYASNKREMSGDLSVRKIEDEVRPSFGGLAPIKNG